MATKAFVRSARRPGDIARSMLINRKPVSSVKSTEADLFKPYAGNPLGGRGFSMRDVWLSPRPAVVECLVLSAVHVSVNVVV